MIMLWVHNQQKKIRKWPNKVVDFLLFRECPIQKDARKNDGSWLIFVGSNEFRECSYRDL